MIQIHKSSCLQPLNVRIITKCKDLSPSPSRMFLLSKWFCLFVFVFPFNWWEYSSVWCLSSMPKAWVPCLASKQAKTNPLIVKPVCSLSLDSGSLVVRIMLMWTEFRACYKTRNPGTLRALIWRNLERRDAQEVYPQKSSASVLYLTRTS